VPRTTAWFAGVPGALALAIVVAACGPGPSTGATMMATPGATSLDRSGSAPSPPAASPVASGLLTIPSTFGIELQPGRYSSSPPFDRAFTFEVAEAGWETGHLNGEFFDIIRFDGLPRGGLPARSLAWATPTTIHGPTDAPAAGLSPAAAIAALAGRAGVVPANQVDQQLFGLAGARVDLHAEANNTPLFSGPGGTFGLGIDRDVRLAAVAVDDALLLVLVLATPDDLDAAWAQALAILETVEL